MDAIAEESGDDSDTPISDSEEGSCDASDSDPSDEGASEQSDPDDESDGDDSEPSDGEDCSSDREMRTAPAPDTNAPKCHWNTPEGWANVREAINQFAQEMGKHGHTCAVCGERKHKCKRVTRQQIMLWNIVFEEEELDKALYTQYPKKTHAPNVSLVRINS